MEKRAVPRALRVVRFLLRPILMRLTRRDWQGQENLPATGGFVLAPNHVSHLDPFLIGHFMLDNNVAPRFLAKDALFSIRIIGRLMRAADQIPVPRGTAGAAESLDAACQAVDDGKPITVYPEGTITRDPDAWPMTGHTGAVRIALRTGKPLVPMMQWGAQRILWPYHKLPKIFPRKTIVIRIGEPIDLSTYANKPINDSTLREATAVLMDRLTQMQADVRGEHPSTEPIDVHRIKRSSPGRNRGQPHRKRDV